MLEIGNLKLDDGKKIQDLFFYSGEKNISQRANGGKEGWRQGDINH